MGHLGGVLGRLGGVLEASWRHLGASGRRLGASWGCLGGVLGCRGGFLLKNIEKHVKINAFLLFFRDLGDCPEGDSGSGGTGSGSAGGSGSGSGVGGSTGGGATTTAGLPCTADTPEGPVDGTTDCTGDCFGLPYDVMWYYATDGMCDDGSSGTYIDLNCAEFAYDSGDCDESSGAPGVSSSESEY